MIDLQLSSGLPIKFDEIAERFHYGEGVTFNALNRIPLSSMLPGLLNKSLRYPENVYLEHRNIHHVEHDELFKNSGFNYDILMLPSGLMGVEFIRSHIFYSECAGTDSTEVSEIVEVLSGALTILLQKNNPKDEFDFETRVSEGLVVKIKEGEKFSLPRGYYYTFINTKETPVVFSRFYMKGCMCDYSRFRREQGLAYFAIRKNAKQEIVLNPRYRDIPKIKKGSVGQITFSNKLTLNQEPLYVQALRNANEWIAYL